MTIRRTESGRTLTEDDLDALAEEVKTIDYDVEVLKKRRRGGPRVRAGGSSR